MSLENYSEVIEREIKYNVPAITFLVCFIPIPIFFYIFLLNKELLYFILFIFFIIMIVFNSYRYINGKRSNSRIILTNEGIKLPNFLLSGRYTFIKYNSINKIKGIKTYAPETSILYICENGKRYDIDINMINKFEERVELLQILKIHTGNLM